MSVEAAQPAAQGLRERDPILEIDGLETGYGRTVVLRDVSIVVPAGAVVAVLGPNGAGKTTLLRTISGFLPAWKGRVTMSGVDITREAPHRRFTRGLCHIPEGRGIFRGLTVRDNLVVQSLRGSHADAIERAVDAFPVLGQRLHQRAGTLSGGEQQMLAMAAAYARSSSLILVDEASLGLAPMVVTEIFLFLERVTAEGSSVLVVDQFAALALGLASTAYALRRGEIVYRGSSAELLQSNLFETYLGS